VRRSVWILVASRILQTCNKSGVETTAVWSTSLLLAFADHADLLRAELIAEPPLLEGHPKRSSVQSFGHSPYTGRLHELTETPDLATHLQSCGAVRIPLGQFLIQASHDTKRRPLGQPYNFLRQSPSSKLFRHS